VIGWLSGEGVCDLGSGPNSLSLCFSAVVPGAVVVWRVPLPLSCSVMAERQQNQEIFTRSTR
jgi:hypothetical protein